MQLSRAVWAVWLATLVGGLAVLTGTLTVSTGLCRGAEPCRSAEVVALATWLAIGGGVLAAVAVVAGLMLTVSRWRRSRHAHDPGHPAPR